MKGFCAGLVLAVLSVPVWGQDPAGAEFQVNTYTTGIQFPEGARAVASDGSGNFVVVWTSYNGGDYSVFGQRFNASGIPQGSEFPVNTYTTGAQGAPAVASDANGNFVVVWKSNGQDGSGFGVFGRRFNASGVALASEFRVNTYTTGSQGDASVASDANGNFVVVWDSVYQSYSGAFGRRFNASGIPQGSEFQVGSYPTSSQRNISVASDR